MNISTRQPTADRQRIDKWLWHSRLVRTRAAAADLAASGHVRVNGTRVTAPSRAVRPGDVVTVSLYQGVRVLKVTGSKSKLTFQPLPQDDPKQRCPDISKAKRILGWEPRVDLESGLRLSMDYFKQAIAMEDTAAAMKA